MKIQAKLVFDKRTNELIGFIDLGEENLNEALTSINELATHALAFLVRGVATDFKYTLVYFLTKDVTSYQLMSLFWKAVCVLEIACNLWICAAVSDGASPDQQCYEMHADIADNSSEGLVHATINLFCPSRKIYFFSDAPHLMKTARNCLFNSGSGKRTRHLWNNDKYMLWEQIAKLFLRFRMRFTSVAKTYCGSHSSEVLFKDEGQFSNSSAEQNSLIGFKAFSHCR